MQTFTFKLLFLFCILTVPISPALCQRVEAPGDRSQREEPTVIRTPSRTKTILTNILGAVLEVLCTEAGRCAPPPRNETENTSEPPLAFDTPGSPAKLRSPNAAPNSTQSTHLNFSFATPTGWQRSGDASSVTIAQPSEYLNGNLTNGVILGLYYFDSGNFEKGVNKYLRELRSRNKYLKGFGRSETELVDGIPCVANHFSGLSPKTHLVEQVAVYACQRSPIYIFYMITVNSGQNAAFFEEHNTNIARSIRFR